MMKPLRRYHRYVWLVLSILLPFGIIMAWLVITNPQPIKAITTSIKQPLPIVKHSKDLPDYQVTLRTNKEETMWQLEWNNKKPLIVPSAVIYRLNTSDGNIISDDLFRVNQAELIGRIETTGTYIFELPVRKEDSARYHFLLYDFIHETIMDTIHIPISSDDMNKKEESL
jgi:hypothetical protein